MKSNEKNYINNYASVVYAYYTRENKVIDIRDYPDYIAEEIGLGFSIPFIKGLIKKGLLSYGEEKIELTQAGEEFLNENWDLVKFFNLACPYIGVIEYIEAAKTAKEGQNFEQIILEILTKKTEEFHKNRNYVAVESLHVEMAQIYLHLGIEDQALYHYLTTLCYEVSGIKEFVYVRNFRNKKITKKELIAKYNDCIYVIPEIIEMVARLKDHLYPEIVDDIYNTESLGFTLCSRDNFRHIIEMMADGTYSNSHWQSIITEIFKKRMGFSTEENENKEPVKEITQDAEKIISKEDSETEFLESEAKLAEIAEEESKK